MKKKTDNALLLQLVLGTLGALLNLAVLLAGYDEKGLPKPWFLPGIGLLLLCLAVIVLPAVKFFATDAKPRYRQLFTASTPAAAALAAAALGMVVVNLSDLVSSTTSLSMWRCLTGIAGGIAMGLCAWCRVKGTRPVWLCWGLVTAHMALVLICGYLQWSREPSLLAFMPEFLACINLTLCAYQQAAADGGAGSMKHYLIHSLICVALCPIAMVGSDRWLVYFTFWLYHSINIHCLNWK